MLKKMVLNITVLILVLSSGIISFAATSEGPQEIFEGETAEFMINVKTLVNNSTIGIKLGDYSFSQQGNGNSKFYQLVFDEVEITLENGEKITLENYKIGGLRSNKLSEIEGRKFSIDYDELVFSFIIEDSKIKEIQNNTEVNTEENAKKEEKIEKREIKTEKNGPAAIAIERSNGKAGGNGRFSNN